MKIIDYTSDYLNIDRFEALPGEAWCMLGSNRSGIDLFFKLIAGEMPALPGQVERADDCGILSFESQQALFEEELKNDDTDFMDRLDPGTLVRDMIIAPETHQAVINAFDLARVLDQGYRQLSTGQARKVLLLSHISKGVKCLLIQSPYDGLDPNACRELNHALALCAAHAIQILITVNNVDDIPDWATHIGVLDQGKIILAGPKQSVLSRQVSTPGQADFKARLSDLLAEQPPEQDEKDHVPEELLRIEDADAGYMGKNIFTGLSFTIRTGDHTLVTGPNGSGKSTLLQMIAGDHPACYQNRMWLFGTRRGTGESIWELKEKMGIVSPDLHRNYTVPGSALDCVLSGLFDSIGLYTAPAAQDRKKAMDWLRRISLQNQATTPFRNLSFADQRLALIARALIKLPKLLILDEPTQGLDQANRHALLDFLEEVAQEEICTILYVSHREDENRGFFRQVVSMTDFKA